MKLAEVIAKVKSLEAKVAALKNTETHNCQLEKMSPKQGDNL